MRYKKSKQQLTAAMAESDFSCASSEHYLLSRYGATMSLPNVAEELGTTSNALRIRQWRLGDLPTPIAGLRGYRWSTAVIAKWIAGLTGPFNWQAEVRQERRIALAAKQRGRSRKCRSLTPETRAPASPRQHCSEGTHSDDAPVAGRIQ